MHLVGLVSSYFAHDARSQEPKAYQSYDEIRTPVLWLQASHNKYIFPVNTNISPLTVVHTKINSGAACCLNLTQLQGSPHIGLLVITPPTPTQTPSQFRFPVAPNLPRFVKHPAKLCNCLSVTREVYRRITAAFLLRKGCSSV